VDNLKVRMEVVELVHMEVDQHVVQLEWELANLQQDCQGHACPSSNHMTLYSVGVPYQASDYSNEDSKAISAQMDNKLLQR